MTRLFIIFLLSCCAISAAGQKKDSTKEPQQASRQTAKPDSNRKAGTTAPATKKTTAPKQTQPAKQQAGAKQQAAAKKDTGAATPVKTAGNKTKTTRQPAVNTKTSLQKDSVRRKNIQPGTAGRPALKKDSATVKKVQHTPGIRRDSVRRVANAAPAVKKDTTSAPPLSAADSARRSLAIADSIREERRLAALEQNFNLTRQILEQHPYYAFGKPPVISPYSKREKSSGEEIYFYTLAGIMLLFAGFKTAFAKYFENLTTLFFRRTLKQRQLEQQLSQNTLPSLLFNILFVLVAGYYLSLMAEQLSSRELPYPFWQLFAFAVLLVAIVYIAKFFLLKLFGWLFRIQHLTDAYIFLIFLVSKILVLFLLPVIVITALGGTGVKTIIWTLSWIVIAALFLYRFVIALQMAQKSNKISLFHFFVYLVAFELLPAFVIYKFILHFLTGNSVPLHPI
ncbi:DUF4271 domain-containing protein [Niabella beijingensis]|uniref:DUF4271 domain-containing protein n=1 Tax=Niabella beijingensis TaxID=2872700 RepID=UPI001CBDC4B2|nr:DUF4271 domain-containing protein [Niabella beijingensis]MBZ4188390.1 DUF4271 domain-containing protein [Niabella beijingensis]